MQKIIVQPHAMRTEFLKVEVPYLNSVGIVLAMTPTKLRPGKINFKGDVQTHVWYTCSQLHLVDRYVEVDVEEDFGQEWNGSLFGFNVRGKGGNTPVRGCRVK